MIRNPAPRSLVCALLSLGALLCADARPAMGLIICPPCLDVRGGLLANDSARFQGRVFTWLGDPIVFSGNVFVSGGITVHLNGPLNTLGVAPADRELGVVNTDNQGNIVAGIDSPPTLQIPLFTQPGLYEVFVNVPRRNFVFKVSGGFINIIPPTTYRYGPQGIFLVENWSTARGGRDGTLGDKAPERTDPEWVSVWGDRPVAMYGTVVQRGYAGDKQPAFISGDDWPGWHFGHDADLIVLPDEDYSWTLGEANFKDDPNEVGNHFGTVEVEWEVQNGGSPSLYDEGSIGLPLWAMPTAGDRLFMVGRWVYDNGHPDEGDRTELHPLRMIATMRKRNTAVPFRPGIVTRASQVDIYVSGHGGGANTYPDALAATIDKNVLGGGGLGGGRLRDFLSTNALGVYSRGGPAHGTVVDLFTSLLGGDAALINGVAGPSALGWVRGPAIRPINDMDYDFDVPLPAPPVGATTVQVQVTSHPEHATGVSEVITYTNPDSSTGLPTTAHIHLPYNGADNNIYARTLRFSWDQFSPPGEHFVVTLDRFSFIHYPGVSLSAPWHMWTDISGQWVYLTNLNSFFLSPRLGNDVSLKAASFDVYLDPDDELRVLTQGYVGYFDDLFGYEVGRPAYKVGLDVAEAYVSDNGHEEFDLGGALFPNQPAQDFDGLVGKHTVLSENRGGPSPFSVDFKVKHVPPCGINIPGQAPQLLKPDDKAHLANVFTTLKWAPANCASRYKVVLIDPTTNKRVINASVDATVLKYTTGALKFPHTYKWFVSVCNDVGCNNSVPRRFTTPSKVP